MIRSGTPLCRLTVLLAAAVSAFVVLVSATVRPAQANPNSFSSLLIVNDTPLSSGHTTVTLTYHATENGYTCWPGEPPTGSPIIFAMDGSVLTDTAMLNNECQANEAITLTQAQACQGQRFTAALYDPATASQYGPASTFYEYVPRQSGPDPCHPFTVPPPSIPPPTLSPHSTPATTPAQRSIAPQPPAPSSTRAITPVGSTPSTSRAQAAAPRKMVTAATPSTAPPSALPTMEAPSPSATPVAYLGDRSAAAAGYWWLGGVAGAVLIALAGVLLVRRTRRRAGSS